MKLFLYSLVSVSLFILPSCKKECDFWMEGDDCETEVRIKYYGQYQHIEDGEVHINGHPSIVEYPDNPKRLILHDELLGPMYLLLTSESDFVIPYQQSYSEFVLTVYHEGSGSFNGNQMNYNITTTSAVSGDDIEWAFQGSK